MAKKLKEIIADLVREHQASLERERQESEKRRLKKQQEDRDQAKAVVSGIPDLVKQALDAGYKSVCLHADADIEAGIDCLHGEVTNEIIRLLTAEGLRDQLWIDIDASGNYLSRNSLHLRIV